MSMSPTVLRSALAAAFLALPAAWALAQATPAAGSASAPATTAASAATETGKLASYGHNFAGRRTASGERYNPDALTMAHKTLPFGTRVKVTNLSNNKSVTLHVNDRGPTQADRIGDVSQAAARKLGMTHAGVVEASIEVVAAAPAKKG